MSNPKEKAHNDGQKDFQSGTYKEPVPINVIDEFTESSETLERWNDINESYRSGWNNARKQS